jgi:hypothetical protein
VIERHIVRKLPNVYNIAVVQRLSDADVERIAAEPPGKMEQRQALATLASRLTESLDALRSEPI